MNRLHHLFAHSIDYLIARWLRIGVTTASLLAGIGGVLYLLQHGDQPLPDYTTFSYTNHAPHFTDYTTVRGILGSFLAGEPAGWIQLGVIVLFLTPLMRVALALVSYIVTKDKLYTFITALVLGIILLNYFL